jgi:hypothetical protein
VTIKLIYTNLSVLLAVLLMACGGAEVRSSTCQSEVDTCVAECKSPSCSDYSYPDPNNPQLEEVGIAPCGGDCESRCWQAFICE